MTAEQTIDYESLQQEALRGVVKAVLTRVARSGLPGDHHLYISFDVKAPGVVLSKRLREKYPNEMTIVLQYRFWDLAVTDERFEVKLTFDGIPERLVVPFPAIKVFIDPSVRYVLHFEDPLSLPDEATLPGDGEPGRPGTTRPGQLKRPRPPRPRPARNERDGLPAGLAAVPSPAPSPVQKLPSAPGNGAHKAPAEAPAASGEATAPVKQAAETVAAPPAEGAPAGGAQVVSLDAFRKK